jgi:hypothetical protein
MMKRKDIAAIIERDLLHTQDAKPDTTRCFSCGLGMTCRDSRFCSARCRKWCDDGNPGYAQDWLLRKPGHDLAGWRIVIGPPGVEVGADHCKPMLDAFSASRRDRGRRHQPRPKIAYYFVKTSGHGYWQPSAELRRMGFQSVDCGFDGPDAWEKARRCDEAARQARAKGHRFKKAA